MTRFSAHEFCFAVVVVVLSWLSVPAHAGTWLGGDGNWTNATLWSSATYPGDGGEASATVVASDIDDTVTLDSNAVFTTAVTTDIRRGRLHIVAGVIDFSGGWFNIGTWGDATVTSDGDRPGSVLSESRDAMILKRHGIWGKSLH